MFSHSFSFATQKTNREEEGHRDQKRSKKEKKKRKKGLKQNKVKKDKRKWRRGKKTKDGEWEFSRERSLNQCQRGERAVCCC